MSANGMVGGGVSPRADTVRAKASAARSVNGASPMRRWKRADVELVADVVSLIVFIMHAFLMLAACPSGQRSWHHQAIEPRRLTGRRDVEVKLRRVGQRHRGQRGPGICRAKLVDVIQTHRVAN